MSPRKVSDWLLSLVHRSYNERLPGVGRIRKKCFSPGTRFVIQVIWLEVYKPVKTWYHTDVPPKSM